MEIINAIPDIPRLYTALAEWGACLIFIFLLPKRFRPAKTGAICLGMLLVQSLFLMSTAGAKSYLWIIWMVLAFLLMVLLLFFCCEVPKRDVVYCAVHALILAEFIASFEWQCYCFYYYETLSVKNGLPLFFAFCIVFYLCYGLLLHRQRHSDAALEVYPQELAAVCVLAIVSFVVSNLSFLGEYLVFGLPITSVYGEAVSTIRSMVDLCGVAMMFALFVLRIELRSREELDTLHRMFETQYRQYEQSKEAIDLINYKYHDLKHQIAYLRSEENPKKREELLAKMEGEIRHYEAQNKTGNTVLDTILTAKTLACQKEGIELNCVADGGLLDFIEIMDLCSLLGNALDNAIECERQIADPDKRLIHVAIFAQKNFLILRFENYFEGALHEVSGLPVTTKEDKEFHGYGLKSIQYTAKKYGGAASVSARDGWFELKVLIPMEGK